MEKTEIVDYLTTKFGKEIESIYGIGSFFESSLNKKSDVDVIVLLKSVENAPKLDWTTNRYEVVDFNGLEVWYLYGDFESYLDQKLFNEISFANWEWGVRCLKFGSTLLYGKDIRDQLPIPPYNTPQIFKRSLYYLEPTPDWKMKKSIKENGIEINEQLRLSKSIFKFGFFLIASVYPDDNKFTKNDVYELLKNAINDRLVSKKFLKYYQDAIDYRNGVDFSNFNKYRKKFMIFAIRSGMRHLEIDWKGNEEKKGIYDLLQEGMGSYPFITISIYYNNFGNI